MSCKNCNGFFIKAKPVNGIEKKYMEFFYRCNKKCFEDKDINSGKAPNVKKCKKFKFDFIKFIKGLFVRKFFDRWI